MTEVVKQALKAACDYLVRNAEIRDAGPEGYPGIMIPYKQDDAAAMEAAILFNTLTGLRGN